MASPILMASEYGTNLEQDARVAIKVDNGMNCISVLFHVCMHAC